MELQKFGVGAFRGAVDLLTINTTLRMARRVRARVSARSSAGPNLQRSVDRAFAAARDAAARGAAATAAFAAVVDAEQAGVALFCSAAAANAFPGNEVIAAYADAAIADSNLTDSIWAGDEQSLLKQFDAIPLWSAKTPSEVVDAWEDLKVRLLATDEGMGRLDRVVRR